MVQSFNMKRELAEKLKNYKLGKKILNAFTKKNIGSYKIAPSGLLIPKNTIQVVQLDEGANFLAFDPHQEPAEDEPRDLMLAGNFTKKLKKRRQKKQVLRKILDLAYDDVAKPRKAGQMYCVPLTKKEVILYAKLDWDQENRGLILIDVAPEKDWYSHTKSYGKFKKMARNRQYYYGQIYKKIIQTRLK